MPSSSSGSGTDPAEPSPPSWRRRPGEGAYARSEAERRYLCREVPPGATGPRRILDRYLRRTSLRLRLMSSGREVTYKLGQKVRPRADDPGLVMITNLYLTAGEYAVLAGLEADELEKTRFDLREEGRRFSVDRFEGAWSGLVLAEEQVEGGEGVGGLPGFALAEVTGDDRYSGGRLAAASEPERRALVARLG